METNAAIVHTTHTCSHGHSHHHHHVHDVHETKTKIVVGISFLTMVAEIIFGYFTNSMALLSDGWHMASHVLAIGIAWFAYAFSRKNRENKKYKNGTAKVLSLSGYTSGLLLLGIAIFMGIECIMRLFKAESILYSDAILVAIIGMVVNIICAFVLHTKHDQQDENIKAAYLHVLADAVTSVIAILCLSLGKYFSLHWLDAIGGIIGSVVILKWSYGLIKQAAGKLLDYQNH
ncbi:MAG: cation diffusion facilitator family transporter [Sphingobacteriaceae bacterium]|jgi:cation diffusion facilitator family transporter